MLEHIIVSELATRENNASAIVHSNAAFVEVLQRNFVKFNELSPDSLKSYCVHQYENLMNTGGFSEYVYRTGWAKDTITYLVDGLESLNALAHIALLAKFTEKLMVHGADGIACLYDKDHPQNQQMRDYLDEDMAAYFETSKHESLIDLNAHWLKKHPKLVVMDEYARHKQIQSCITAVPDRLKRIAEVLAKEPKHLKMIRLLCDHADVDFIDLLGEDALPVDSEIPTAIWHFTTVQGPHYMSQNQDSATLFESTTHTELATMSVTDEVIKPSPKTRTLKI